MVSTLSQEYQPLLKEDYHRNIVNMSQAGKKINYNRLIFIHSLFGYKVLPKDYFSITYHGWNTDHAFLFLESDGILLLFTTLYTNGANFSNCFTGTYKFISYNQIKNVKETNKYLRSKIILNYSVNNFNHIISFIIHNPTVLPKINNKLSKIRYTGKMDTYILRIRNYKQNSKTIAIKNTINDYSHHHQCILSTLKSLFTWKLNKIASRREFTISLLLSILCSFCTTLLPTNSIIKYLIYLIIYGFLVMNGIRRIHDIQYPIISEFLLLIPFLNIIFIIYLVFKPSIIFPKKDIINILK